MYNKERQFEEPVPPLEPAETFRNLAGFQNDENYYQSMDDKRRLSNDPIAEIVQAEMREIEFIDDEVATRSATLDNDNSNSDPLADDGSIKVEQLEFAAVQPNDLELVNCLLEDNNTTAQSINEENESVENSVDDEVTFLFFDANNFPRPITELRSGLVKRENDSISGNLCFQQTVRIAIFYHYSSSLINIQI